MPKSPISRRTSRLAQAMTVLVFVSGALLTLAGWRISEYRHLREVEQVFDAQSASMKNAVERQVGLFMDVLSSISQLHQLSDNISADDLAEFTAKGLLFQKRILGSYGFVQRVSEEIRLALAAESGSGFVITARQPDGSFAATSGKPEYYPLMYQYPDNALGAPLGADISTLPGAADTLSRMNRSMGPVVAAGLQVQHESGRTGYLVFSPIYQLSGDGRAVFTGFTMSILWPHIILQRALEGVSPPDILVRFYHGDEAALDIEHTTGLMYWDSIGMGDQNWHFEAMASREYLGQHRSALPKVILLAGFSITVLATLLMTMLSSRTRRIESVVQTRTAELQETNRLLSRAMEEQLRLEREILHISDLEKQQIGHDLHDSLGQKLTGAVFLSRALAAGMPDEAGPDIRDQAGKITDILKDSVAQVRRMARGLSPVELGKEGLDGALHRLAEETSSVFSVSCLYHQQDVRPPVADAAAQLYAIAMEAVNNAVKHGGATEIVIEFGTGSEGQTELRIEDNGKGFSSDEVSDTGMGLRIMKYRASVIGGRLTVEAREEGGVRVTCRLS